MPILEEEKTKFFAFLDKFLKDGSNMEFEDMKTDGGVQYPKEAYLYVPDATKPSTWKLRIWESPETKVTVRQLGRAAAAFSSGGFRGQKVYLPADEVKTVKSKLVSAYKKAGVKESDIPNYLLDEGGDIDMPDLKRLEDVEKKLQEIEEKDAKERKSLEDSYKKSIEELEKKLSETHAKELESTNKKLEDTEKRLSERETDLHKEKVSKKCDDLIAKGFWPAVVNKVKAVMLAEVGSKSTVKLDEKEVSFGDAVIDILETIPADVRISFEDKSHSNKNTDPNKKYMTEKEVEAYAKDNKMSFQEACSVLASEGKIEI